jgi:hypothetical protein
VLAHEGVRQLVQEDAEGCGGERRLQVELAEHVDPQLVTLAIEGGVLDVAVTRPWSADEPDLDRLVEDALGERGVEGHDSVLIGGDSGHDLGRLGAAFQEAVARLHDPAEGLGDASAERGGVDDHCSFLTRPVIAGGVGREHGARREAAQRKGLEGTFRDRMLG